MDFYLKRIGNSKFFWDIPYDIREIPEEMNVNDNSWLAQVTNPGDRETKNTVSFRLCDYKHWDDSIRFNVHFHSYPDKDTECYNPVLKLDDKLSNDEKIQWVIDFLNKNATDVNNKYLERIMTCHLEEIKRRQKIIERLNFATDQFYQ